MNADLKQSMPFSIRRLLSTGGWVSFAKVITILAGVIVNALLARMLEPQELGIYFLIFSIVTTAVLLAQMGLNQAVIRFIGELRGKGCESGIRDLLLKSFSIVGLSSVLFALIYLFFARNLAAELFHASLMAVGASLLAVWIVFTSLRSLAAECLRGFEAIGWATLFEGLLTSLLFLTFVAWLWFDGRAVDLYQVFVLLLLAASISMVFALYSLWRRVSSLGDEKRVGLSRLMSTSLPLLGSNIMFVFLSSFGLWMVGYLASPEDVAQYGAATRLVALAQFPLLALNAIVPPMIARMYARNEMMELQHLLRWCASLVLILTMLVMIVFVFWGGELLGLIFGSFYSQAHELLVILGLGVLANAWAGYCGPVLMMCGHQNAMLRQALLTVLLTIPAAIMLGTAFGAIGVAVSMSLGVTLLHVLWWWSVRSHLGIWTHAGFDSKGFSSVR